MEIVNYNFSQLKMHTEQTLLVGQVNSTFINDADKLQILHSHLLSGISVNSLTQHNKTINHNQIAERPPQTNLKFTGCSNKLCKNHNTYNKENSVEICLQTLCHRCQQQFKKDSYCIYCKQIYFDETDDGKQWIMCEECLRWVHSACADFNTKQNPNAVFQCIKCKKIEAQPHGRRHIQRAGYAKLQKKKNNDFLSSIGFDWQLTAQQISQDMETIRKYLG